MTPAICQSIVSAHTAGEAVAAIARRFRLSRQSVYTALRQEGVFPGRARPSPGPALEILPEDAFLRLLPREGLVLIIGPQGSGKSAVAYRLLELLHQNGRPVAAIGPAALRPHLPPWILLVPSLQDVPRGAAAVFDEAHVSVSSRTAMTTTNRNVVHLVGFTRQRGYFIIVVGHHASDLDRRLIQHTCAVLIKRPAPFAVMDRPALRDLLARALRAFSRAPGDPHRLTFVVAGGKEALVETALASYWSEGLSRVYADWIPPQPTRDREAAEAGGQAEEEARRQAQEDREQAKAARLQRQREHQATTWFHRALDDGLPMSLATQHRAKALRGWTAERLKKLKGVLHVLVAGGTEAAEVARFIVTRPDEVVTGELRLLARALTTLTRLKVNRESRGEFLALFWQRPREAVEVLDAAQGADPTWRASIFGSRVRERLAALAQEARAKAVAEALASLLGHLFRGPPPAPTAPPRESITVTLPAGPVEAEVLTRDHGKLLIRLPGGRVLSLPDDGRARGPPPRCEP